MNFEDKVKNGEIYFEDEYPDNLIEENFELMELLHDFNNCRPKEIEKKKLILKKIFAEYGEECTIYTPFHASWGKNIHMKDHVYLNYNVTIIDDTDVYIGSHVMIAPNVVISSASHPLEPGLRYKTAEFNKPVVIEDNVWVGANSVILCGVHIGKNSVIGAGSIVTKDIPDNVVAVGSPCKVIKKI